MRKIVLAPGSASLAVRSAPSPTRSPHWARRALALAIGGIALVATGLSHADCPSENFDAVTAPNLPPGWTFGTAPNNTGVGTFGTVTSAFDTTPNAAFSPDFVPLANSVNDVYLTSPAFTPAQGTALTFRNQWNMRTNMTGSSYYDGGVLEISINGGPYQDIVAAGGGFVTGGYNLAHRIVTSSPTPLGNRYAWAGNSAGAFVTSKAALPPAATGQSARVRFRTAIAATTTIALPAGSPGWWIDTLSCTAAPPMLTQAFSPANTPVGAPTTLTLALSYPNGGATLTGDLVDTLPAGLAIAATPNATTTCSAGSVSTTANALILAMGAQIPASGCTVSVDVVASAAGNYANTLLAGVLQTTAGSNPADSQANYQAVQAGVPTYVSGFEAPTYAIGNLLSQDGWVRTGFGLNDVKVAATHPLNGSQHLHVQTALPDGNGYQGYTSKLFQAGTSAYSVATLNVAFPTAGTPAPFDVIAQDVDAATTLAVPIAKLRFNGNSAVQVQDANGAFADTGATWTSGSTYHQVRIVTRRADASVLVCLDGTPIHVGQGNAANTRSLQFAVQRQAGIVNDSWDIDDVSIDNRDFGGCGDAAGLTAPLVAKSFAPSTLPATTDATATITLTNPNELPLTLSADLVDTLPAGMTASASSTTCSGSASFTAGTIVLAAGATIPPGSCTLTGTVQAAAIGSYVNTVHAGDLQTDGGANPLDASATLTATDPPVPPTVATSFAPSQVEPSINSTARVVFGNPNAFAITLEADFVDTLPSGLVPSAATTTCSGSASFNPASLKLLAGATLPAGSSCMLIGTVHADAAGSYVNTIPAGASQTTAGGNTAGASATLTVASTSGGVTLEQTVGTDLTAGACATTRSLIVETRTPVNFCYRLTNHTSTTLNYQTVQSSTFGRLLNYQPIALAPGQTYQFNDIRVLSSDVVDSAQWTGDDTLPGYTFATNDGSVAWDDISSTGAIFPGDLTSTIAFDFPFFSEPQTKLDFIDGGLAFGRSNASYPFVNTALPSTDAGMALSVLPYWDRWSSTSGTLYWQVKGTAPNRRLITQWHNRKFVSTNPNGIRYQAVLFEATGQIAFVYDQVDDGITNPGDSSYQYSFGKSATIGLSFDATHATQYSYFPDAPDNSPTPVVQNGDTIMFTPTPLVAFSDGDAVAVTVVAPEIVADESPIDVTVGHDASNSRDFVIGNSGTGNLLWTLDPALAAASHLPSTTQAWPARATLGVNPDRSLAFRSPNGASTVPGYVYTLSAGSFSLARMNLDAPQALDTIATYTPSADFDVTGLEFFGTDFSKLYSLAYSNGAFQSLDAATGTPNLIGYAAANSGGGEEARQDMAYDPVSGKLYALTLHTTNATVSLRLYTIDPATSESTYVTQLQGLGLNYVNAIGINSQGQMYGIDVTQSRLIAIDKATGQTAVVGPLGFDANSDQSLEYDDSTDTMYWIGGIFQPGPNITTYKVFTVNTETGAATLLGDFGSDPLNVGTSGLAIPRANPCMLPSQVPWISLSEGSGVVGPTDTDTVHITFDSTGLAAGTYSAQLCLGSNDPLNPRIRVPVTMTVNAANTPPGVTCSPTEQTFSEGDAVSLDLSTLFTDADGDVLTYTMTGAPASLSLDANSGLLAGTLAAGDATGSPYAIDVTAHDPQDATASTTISLVVQPNGDELFHDGFDGMVASGICH